MKKDERKCNGFFDTNRPVEIKLIKMKILRGKTTPTPENRGVFFGGKGGIRTLGTNKLYNRFRVCRIRPLCHLSFKCSEPLLRQTLSSVVCLRFSANHQICPSGYKALRSSSVRWTSRASLPHSTTLPYRFF